VRQVQDFAAPWLKKPNERDDVDVAAKAATYKHNPIKLRAEKRLDIFLYGNVMLGHGEGGYNIGCV
jgi:hypothetical protein